MKSDATFQLESAAWPAFLVEAGGTVRHANQAAIQFFGAKLEGDACTLGSLWAQGEETVEQFLARCERSATSIVPIRYTGKGGRVASFATYICPLRDLQKRYLFQLIQEKPPAAAASGDLSVLGIPEGKPNPGDTGTIHRQKLDCAIQLTRTVALDFNNALTAILGHSSFLLGKMEADHPWRVCLVQVEKAAQKAAEITHLLTAFSRQEKEPPELAAGNLNAVLRRVVEGFRKSSPPEINWELQLEPQLFTVKFDEPKVQQAFAKVLENAREAVRDRGRVTISSQSLEISEPTQDRTAHLVPGTYVCIAISDDGPGIDPEALPRVFEPFFTTKHKHRGLGLAWVYGIITNHRGGVAVSSQPGHGTSVRIYLPASQTIVDEPVPATPVSGPKQTVLFVDDEDLILNLGQTILSAFGYQVLTANSGERALELIGQSRAPIDLVVTDLAMPRMSGRELIDQLQLRLPGIPILCMSGFHRPGTDQETSVYLAKPFTSGELVRRVGQCLSP